MVTCTPAALCAILTNVLSALHTLSVLPLGGVHRLVIKLPCVVVQDTVADMAKDMRDSRTGSAAASAEELYQFMQKVPFVAI